MNILGISAFYHDSAACLVQEGNIIAAAHEERFSRVKHDARFPAGAIAYCLREGKISAADIDFVCYYDKPLLTFERLMETYLAYAPRGVRSFAKALPLWLHHKLHIPGEIKRGLGGDFRGRILFSQHHLSHAASAFYPSPFERAAILTIDGVGEWSTTTIGKGVGNKIEFLKETRFPHSLGLLYSAFTYYLGFTVNSGEYKLMGLAPYGQPKYTDLILEKVIDVKDDGSFWMDMSYFNYCSGLRMTSKKFHALFAMEPKQPGAPFEQKHLDIAASIQEVTNQIMLRLARRVRDLTGESRLCLAGGVALNSVANGLIRRAGIFEDIWIQPAAGDAGGALGAALATWHLHLGNDRQTNPMDSQQGSYLGPACSSDDIKHYLDRIGAKYSQLTYDDTARHIAEALDQQLVVGLVQGRMEYGPRALGARSILADARSPQTQSRLNLKIKFRESFRPFAPAVLQEDVGSYFEGNFSSPYMMLVEPIKGAIRKTPSAEDQSLQGIDRLKWVRSSIPAVTHVDFSGRLQTVTKEHNGFFYDVIKAFKDRTGCGVIVNTSFNIRGEPIVNTPDEAYRCFMWTDMDMLVLENIVLHKTDQPPFPGAAEYRAQFGVD